MESGTRSWSLVAWVQHSNVTVKSLLSSICNTAQHSSGHRGNLCLCVCVWQRKWENLWQKNPKYISRDMKVPFCALIDFTKHGREGCFLWYCGMTDDQKFGLLLFKKCINKRERERERNEPICIQFVLTRLDGTNTAPQQLGMRRWSAALAMCRISASSLRWDIFSCGTTLWHGVCTWDSQTATEKMHD